MSEKKLSISKKTVLIASALVLAVGLPIAYLLWTSNQEDTGAWYNSSWLYRRSISVANPGSTLTNEDVLIEYDTATLVTAGKLQSDCDDLRFVDSDDSTALAYWIEGGCNTTTTHIWVRIPSLTSGGKTIYMYYGNSSATNAEETWTGKFYIMKDAACDSGWTTESNSGGDFYLKFPYPASTFGSTGGASSHNHGSYNMNTSTIATGTNTNTSGSNSISIGHYHNVDVVVADNTSVLPPYLDMIFCSNNDLIVKQNGVTIFTSTVPSGFTQFSALNSKFPRGNSSYGGTSTTTTHTHNITATTGAPSSTGTNNTGGIAIPSGTHTHTATGTTGTGTHIPEYMTVIYGEAASGDVMAPSGMITMSNATPPLGWTRYSALDSKFTYGSTTYGLTGGTSTHTHLIPSLTFLATLNTVLGSTSTPRTSLPGSNHTHSTSSITSNSYSNIPPYISTLFIQKKTSQSVSFDNEELYNQPPSPPSSLLTEGLFNPNGVTDTTPEFTAIYSDPDSNDGTFYEIEVNTQSDFQGTYLWNTGKMATTPIKSGTRSPEFSYTGSTLTLNGATYYWRIRFWDINNSVSGWSNIAQFSLQDSLQTKELTGDGFDIGPMSIESQSYYSESTGESTWSTDTTYQDKTTMTFTPESNSTYLIIASWLMRQTTLGTGYYVQGKLTRTTGTVKDFNELIYYPKDATDYISGGTIGIDTFGESPSSQTYKIQYKTSSATRVARIKEAKMIALKLDTNIDKYAESETRTTTTSTTYQDKTTLTFTPASTCDYIILASATLDGSSASYDYRAQLTIDGTAYSTTNIETNLAANRELWFVVKKVNLSSASHTIKIQYSSESTSGTTGIADARIVAIRADRFLNNYYAENETRATTTSTSYQTYLTLTDTPQATDHLILAVEDLDASSTSYSTYGQALKGATTYGEMLREAKDATGRGMQYFTLKKETLTNSSTSWYLQYRTENASGTAGINNGRILVLELTEPSINVGTSGSQITTVAPSTSNFYTGGAFTLVRDASTDTVTSITVSETGTISDSNISGLILYYKQEASCSSSIPGDATQFNSTAGTFSSGSSTVTGSMSVGTSQICLYAEVDVGSASNGDTIELQITNPSTQVIASKAVTPATAVAINGTTTVTVTNNNPDPPSSLLTETATNPIKVEDTTPEFSAVFTDDDTGDTGTHYEIEVNTSSDFTGTVMWDSDQQSITTITNGARSSDISYGVVGTPVTLTLNGATYYWRMKFWDNNGAASAWSSTAQFTMSGVPYAPSSLQAEGSTNPTDVTDTTPEFSAIHTDPNGDSTTHYEIEVNTLSNFSGTVMWDTGQQTITVVHNARSSEISYGSIGTPQTLTLNGSTYYWRIRFWDASGVSDWSSTAQFTMHSNIVPNAPSSLYTEAATNPVKVTDTTPEFSAVFTDTNGSDTGTYYEIEVNTASDFTGTVMWDSNQQSITPITNGARSSDISYGVVGTPITLTLNGATYYWRIKFWDNYGGESSWSSTGQFTMSGVPYAPSSLQTEGATNPTDLTDTTPEFSAIHTDPNGDSTTHYEIEVNTQSDFLGTSMWDTNQQTITVANNARSSEISYDGTTLDYTGTTYYWRIRFWDSLGVSDWSSTANFTMHLNIAPDAPSSLLTEGATNPTGVTDTTPEFSAVFTDSNTSDSASYYEIEVNTNNSFTGTVMWDSGQKTTSINNGERSSDFSYAGTTLTPNGTTYYWRIRFWDVYDAVSNWSSTANFTMATNTLPNAPSSLYTEAATNPVKVTDSTPEFSAVFSDTDSGDTGTYYEIEVNTNNNFTGTVMWDSNQQSITPITNGNRSTDIPYAGTTLTENGATYYWRMKFWDIYDAVSSWSSTAQFTMSGPPNAPSSLYAEGTTNPTGVTDLTPEFSAVHTDPNADSTASYQIQVNTQSDFLGTSMWDSNQQSITVANNARSSDISYNGTTLTQNGTTYYWRIKFWDTDSKASGWSSTGQFTMATAGNTIPNAPSSLYTETTTNPTKVTDTTPEFSAVFSDPDGSDTGNYYQIQVNTQSDFLGTSMWDSTKTSTGPITNGARSSDISYAGTTLTENGVTYYWRMKFWDNNNGESNWSSTAQFTMSGVPYAPTSLQTEGSTNPTGVTDTTPEFTAIHTDPNSDSTTHYEIHVNTQSDFNGTSMWESTATALTVNHNARSSEISYNGTTLTLNGTTYYWRIRFYDSISTPGAWSSTGNFTMYSNTAPNTPSSLLAEANTNPTKVTDTTPEFSAVFTDTNGSDTGNYYQIQVNTQSDFLGTSMWDSTQTATGPITNGARSSDISYNGTTLTENGVTYYWRMKFWDNYGAESNWSSTAQFTMSGVPYAPTSLQTEGSTNPTGVTDTTPEFTAIHTDPNGDSTTHYEIEVNTNSLFTGTVMWDSNQTAITVAHNARSAEISYGNSNLTLNGTIYYWRIRFWDSLGVSDWSSTGNFTMSTNTVPNVPSSLYTESSSNPIKVTDTTPEFSAVFTDTDGSDTGNYYEIEVNTQSDFLGTSMWDSGQTAITPITNGSRSSDISYGDTDLTLNGVTYYWRMKFWDNNGGESNWSSTAQFTMSGPPTAPGNLKTDNMTNPTQILSTTPDFKAFHTDPNGDSAIYYEIDVNSQSDFLGTSMWSTGKTAMTSTPSGQYSPNITYAGTALTGESSTTYYWRIRFWDSISDVSEWSSTASFVDYIQDEQYIQMEGVGLERIKIN